jgi:hypothetical protein
LTFGEDIIGNIDRPYTIVVNGASGIGNITSGGNIRVRIVDDKLVVSGIEAKDIDLVEIYDIDGLKLIHEPYVTISGINVGHLTAGVYVVMVRGNGVTTYHKIVLY